MYDRLVEHFFATIFHLIFEVDPPYMINKVESLEDIVD